MLTSPHTLRKAVRRSALVLMGGLVLPFVVGSCSDGKAPEETITLTDEGSACIDVENSEQCEPVTFITGRRLQIEVNFETCLSSSCNRPGPTSCEIARRGAILEVTATGSYVNTNADICSTDCRMLTATCETEELPDGDYEIRYAGNTLPLTIPSNTQHRACTTQWGFGSQCCDEDADCPGASCSEFFICNAPPIPGETVDASTPN